MHRAGDLRDQAIADRVGIVGPRGDVGQDGKARQREPHLLRERGKRRLRRLHVARVEGSADIEDDVAPAGRLEGGLGGQNILLETGDRHLGRRVAVGDIDAVEAAVAQHRADTVFRQAEHCRHAARRRFGHQRAALLDQAKAGLEVEDAGSEQSGVLAQAMARGEGGRHKAVLLQPQEIQRFHRIEGGLGELRELQLPPRIVEAELAQRIAQDGIGGVHQIGKAVEALLAHAADLRALAGKQQRCRHAAHARAFSMKQSSSTRTSRPDV